MGLLGSLIGGAFGLVGAAADAAIDAGVSAHNEKKLNQQINNNAATLDKFMNDCIQYSRQSIEKTKCELYRQGMTEAIEETLNLFINVNGFFTFYVDILDNDKDISEVYEYVKYRYNAVFVINKEYATNEVLKREYYSAKNELIRKTKAKIDELISSESCVIPQYNKALNFFFAVPLLCLLEIVCEDTGYNATICSLHEYHKAILNIFCYLKPLEHGEFDLGNVENSDIERLHNAVRAIEYNITKNETGYYEGLAATMKPEFVFVLAQIMWYYAKKVPFDQTAFDKAEATLNKYISIENSENALECIVAEIYVKNQLGGENLVMQNIDELIKEASFGNPVFARAICSFLAWIECYKIELEVLKKAVQEKIQLTPDMLERLEFLSKGGANNNVKIYDVSSYSNKFMFDSSTNGIDIDGINVIFDLLKRKHQTLKYSLLLNQWTKTIPLPKNKLFSNDSLHTEFKELVKDFDGEIVYSIEDVEAINLNTISYKQSSVFRFTSERNRGVTMIFSCEKFGRNLNIVILTLFTPEENMLDEVSSYARAALGNRYVESFRESILQAVDSSLKDNVEIYDSGTSANQSTFFE